MDKVMLIGGSDDGEIVEVARGAINGGYLRLHSLKVDAPVSRAGDRPEEATLVCNEYAIVAIALQHSMAPLLFGIEVNLYQSFFRPSPYSELPRLVIEHLMRGYQHATVYQSTKP